MSTENEQETQHQRQKSDDAADSSSASNSDSDCESASVSASATPEETPLEPSISISLSLSASPSISAPSDQEKPTPYGIPALDIAPNTNGRMLAQAPDTDTDPCDINRHMCETNGGVRNRGSFGQRMSVLRIPDVSDASTRLSSCMVCCLFSMIACIDFIAFLTAIYSFNRKPEVGEEQPFIAPHLFLLFGSIVGLLSCPTIICCHYSVSNKRERANNLRRFYFRERKEYELQLSSGCHSAGTPTSNKAQTAFLASNDPNSGSNEQDMKEMRKRDRLLSEINKVIKRAKIYYCNYGMLLSVIFFTLLSLCFQHNSLSCKII